MTYRPHTLLLTLASLLPLAISCGGETRVSRTSAKTVTDLSGNWNDTDSRNVSETLVEKFFNHRWLTEFMQEHASPSEKYGKRKPVVLISDIVNESHEIIASDTFIQDIEEAVLSRGGVRIVANSVFRERLRKERANHKQGFVSKESQKRFGKELGADYLISGSIRTIVDAVGQDEVIFYQVNLKMADVETGEMVWSASHKIKKFRGKGRRVPSKYINKIPTA